MKPNTVGRGHQQGMHGCPTCGTILNGVYCDDGNAYNHTMFMCPRAIGEQIPLGDGKHRMGKGAMHRRLEYWVETAAGRLIPYESDTGLGYGHEYRQVAR